MDSLKEQAKARSNDSMDTQGLVLAPCIRVVYPAMSVLGNTFYEIAFLERLFLEFYIVSFLCYFSRKCIKNSTTGCYHSPCYCGISLYTQGNGGTHTIYSYISSMNSRGTMHHSVLRMLHNCDFMPYKTTVL